MPRSNEEWAAAVKAHVDRILADRSQPKPSAVSSLTVPDSSFAATIDHTLLKPDATAEEIDKICDEAIRYKFQSCCVNGANVVQVASRLQGSTSVPCAVIGFPLGAGTSSVKAYEAKTAIADGAQEIDMVINLGALKSEDYALVYSDILAVVEASSPKVVKVIIETVFLTVEQKIAACYIATEAGAGFVKTSTGFLGGGASPGDVTLMKRAVSYKGNVKVKASAGVRTFEKCLEMFHAGADRIGTSSGAAIMEKSATHSAAY